MRLIDDPSAIQRNREAMHAPWYAEPSPWVHSLDGTWAFHLAPCPEAVPDGAELPVFDDRAWARIPVPANWELHGHGEAIYQNIAYPFVPTAYPAAPPENPTGSYRTSFTVPAAWDGRSIFLEFGSVDAAFHCWVNGVEVGFSTDSKLPAHFDITRFVQPGSNHLAVRVYRWPTSAHLEKQDYWHLSGIQRSVRLIAKPTVHLRDWMHQVRFDAAYRDATLAVRAWICRSAGDLSVEAQGFVAYPAVRGWSVAFSLHGADGRTLATCTAPVADRSPMYGPASGGVHDEALSAKAELAVAAPLPWTAETPELYTLVMELRDPAGRVVDNERTRIGFRQLTISDGIIRLNGQRLVFRGVNRHEFHPERGRAVTIADMCGDLLAMKRLNFNAVRTCHYPDADAWYDLCDELGMYVIDEANLETHGMGALASRDPQWATAYLERAIRMHLRDRNHACVVAWSLGNESHVGPHHAAMANWLRFNDPSRPVQYESGNPSPLVTDIMVPMYPQLDWVRRVLADPTEHRPLVMCEYAYAKGNSTGNVRKFWDLIWELPRFQGGFVWDWRDKALARNGRWDYGIERWEPSGTERMCLNGVVGPDLVEHPGAWELRHVQSPVQLRIEDAAAGRVQVINRHQFLDLAGYRLRWELEEDGVRVASGSTAFPDLAPGAAGTVHLVLPAHGTAAGADVHLSLTVERIAATPWAPAGAVIDRVQGVVVARCSAPERRLATLPDLTITGDTLSGPGWSLLLDRSIGSIAGLQTAGRELLVRPILPCLGRAPTDIDLTTGGSGFAGQWEACGLDRAVYTPSVCEVIRLDARRASIRSSGVMAAPGMQPVARIELTWTVLGSGDILGDLLAIVDAPIETIPRIGLVTSLVGADRRMRWFGRGPFENYPDRCEAALVGSYDTAVADLLTPYVFPQECGLRSDVRWLAAVDAAGAGLFAQGMPLLYASALPVRLEDLRAAANIADLQRRDETTLHLDGFHMGLGGDTGWTRNVHPEYRLPPGQFRFRLRLRPLAGGEDLPALGREAIEGSPR
jgi:beta-galactosidase